jgi:hypothetical protein
VNGGVSQQRNGFCFPDINIVATSNPAGRKRLAEEAPSTSRTVRLLAIAALVTYVVALVSPALHDGGYTDGSVVIVEGRPASGLACLFGATFWGIFEHHLLVYPVVSIFFVLSTLLLLNRSSPYPLVRSLVALVCTVAPLHFILNTGHQLYVGSYLWLLSFLISCTSHWGHFFQSVLNDSQPPLRR